MYIFIYIAVFAGLFVLFWGSDRGPDGPRQLGGMKSVKNDTDLCQSVKHDIFHVKIIAEVVTKPVFSGVHVTL